VTLSKGCTIVGAFSDLCHLRMDVELAFEILRFRLRKGGRLPQPVVAEPVNTQ